MLNANPATTDRTDLLDFRGVSRSVLEQRIVDLVAAIADLEQRANDLENRLRGRAEMNGHNHRFTASSNAAVRLNAYETALNDLRELLRR